MENISQNYIDLGDYHKEITTASPECQLWVDRALMHLWGFNQIESIRCFKQAIKSDQTAAFPYWGVSFALGPHYNLMSLPAENYKEAIKYLKLAHERKHLAKDWEKDLIEALSSRYEDPMPSDLQRKLEEFSVAMKKVYEKYPLDLDILALYAESIMNLKPWVLWRKDGEPEPEALLAQEILEKAMKIGFHPQVSHLYIHLLELSPYSLHIVPVAQEMMEKVKGVGHLVHMPSHIFFQAGDYEKSLLCNRRAVEADAQVVKFIGEDNFFTFYRAHNVHFLVWTAMFLGDFESAWENALLLKELVHEKLVELDGDNLEFFYPTYLQVLIRFGKWHEILSDPIETRPTFPLTAAIQRSARSLSYSVLNSPSLASQELACFELCLSKIPETLRVGNNSARQVLEISRELSKGELFYREKRYEIAFEALRNSVRLYDSLIYDEPWDFLQPTRHALAALLLEQGFFAESVEVYLEDLKNYKENVWSLTGLREAYEKLGEVEKTKEIAQRLEKATIFKGKEIKNSCFCKLK